MIRKWGVDDCPKILCLRGVACRVLLPFVDSFVYGYGIKPIFFIYRECFFIIIA